MTDERADAGSKTTSPKSVEPDEDRRRALANAHLARKNAFLAKKKASKTPVADDTREQLVDDRTVEPVLTLIAFVAGNFSSAYIQALGQRAADGSAKLPKRVRDLAKRRVRRKGEPDEYRIGVRDGSAATIAITVDTPDEARLALLDLDVTADEVRGKLLRWDGSASAWRPDDDQ